MSPIQCRHAHAAMGGSSTLVLRTTNTIQEDRVLDSDNTYTALSCRGRTRTGGKGKAGIGKGEPPPARILAHLATRGYTQYTL